MKQSHLPGRALALALTLGLTSISQSSGAEPSKPWRLSDGLDLPGWLDLSGTHRTRYETLDGQFRAGRTGGDQILSFRTTLRADLNYDRFGATAELMDSRQAFADTGTPIDTAVVNTFELLQAYGSFRLDGPFWNENTSELRVGRQTLDLGSRRLVARNSFRNTANAFTGTHWRWQLKDGPAIQAFYFLPHNRLPADAPSLLDNEAQFDEARFDLQFWGVHSEWKGLPFDGIGEAYFFGLHEADSVGVPTRNRELYTPGLRFFRPRARGEWDYDFESVLQFGKTHGSTAAADSADLSHFAHFHHAEAGLSLDQAWSPRAALFFDYASGDESPEDGESNRFDSLFGARRFDHGPTGIYGAFARANIISPGASLGAKLSASLSVELKHRLYWLASSRDAWTTSGVRDASGRSSSFVGHQLEATVRWDILPGNLRFEIGGARLFAGGFIDEAPNASHRGDPTYGYAALEVRW